MTKESLQHAIDCCLAALDLTPSGLFTDIDGTISPIAPEPGLAVIDVEGRQALERLGQRLRIVGAITGRAADDGRHLLGTDDVLIVGNHGYERRGRGEAWIHPSGLAAESAVDAVLSSVQDWLRQRQLPGVLLENKRLSGSIHYRASEDPQAARDAILMIVTPLAEAHGLRVTEGRLVVELRPGETVNKGTALRDIREEFGLRGVVYLGDDVTDVDAFVELHRLAETGVATCSVAVLSPETHPSVKAEATAHVDGVEECIMLLQALANPKH